MNFSKTIVLLLLAFLANSVQAQHRKTDQATSKRGFVDIKGNIVVPFEFDALPLDYDTVMSAKKGRFRGLIGASGQTILPFEYEEVRWQKLSGFALVKKVDKVWGIVNGQGKFVLPMQFEMVAAIDRDMLASRRAGEREIQFYNGQGQPTFKLPGQAADRGFDPNSMLVRGFDHQSRYLTRAGEPIFPESIQNPKWTDGNLIICGDYKTMGIQNFRGDTILPFVHRSVSPALPGQFRVQNTDGETGIVDGRGRIVVPFAHWEIVQHDNFYSVCKGIKKDCGLFSAEGKVMLPAEYSIRRLKETEPYDRNPDDVPDHYFILGMQNDPYLKGFFSAKGASQILPMEYKDIVYRSENFPLIGVKEFENSPKGEAMAFDFQGKPLLPTPVVSLQHTDNPRYLIASDGKGLSFLNLDNVEAKTEFFYRLSPTSTPDFYMAWDPDSIFSLVKLGGEKLYTGNLKPVYPALERLQKRFKNLPNASGELVVVGKKTGMAYYDWICINDSGREFFMTDEEVKAIIAPDPRTEPTHKTKDGQGEKGKTGVDDSLGTGRQREGKAIELGGTGSGGGMGTRTQRETGKFGKPGDPVLN